MLEVIGIYLSAVISGQRIRDEVKMIELAQGMRRKRNYGANEVPITLLLNAGFEPLR
jgi:hypothetical protein